MRPAVHPPPATVSSAAAPRTSQGVGMAVGDGGLVAVEGFLAAALFGRLHRLLDLELHLGRGRLHLGEDTCACGEDACTWGEGAGAC